VKEIKAIIQPFMLNKVLHALKEIEGIPGCTISEAMGYGRVLGEHESERSHEAKSKTKLEVVAPDQLAKKIVQAIQKSAYTGNKGDGRIFVMECVEAIRIRTGDRDDKGC
jgi:nitrogen regulatory protein P-II 2